MFFGTEYREISLTEWSACSVLFVLWKYSYFSVFACVDLTCNDALLASVMLPEFESEDQPKCLLSQGFFLNRSSQR